MLQSIEYNCNVAYFYYFGFSASDDILKAVNGVGLIHSELRGKCSLRLFSSLKVLTVHLSITTLLSHASLVSSRYYPYSTKCGLFSFC
jgi:hypothetical protein